MFAKKTTFVAVQRLIMASEKKFSFKARLHSFKYAFRGVFLLFRYEHNAWIHLIAIVCAVTAGIILSLTSLEWVAILFAIGVGVGMSEKNDGTGGIAALASWLMLTTLLSTGFVTTIMPSIADSATKTLAFDKIANPFIGILAGAALAFAILKIPALSVRKH